jgi:hypothetical protein
MTNEHTGERGKVRLAILEVEGGALVMQEALRVVARLINETVAEPPPSPAIPAALPAPAPQKVSRQYKRRIKDAPAPQAKPPEPEKKMSMSEAIRQAIRESPRTNAEIHDAIKRMGIETDSSTVSTILCQQRALNKIYKGSDLKWHFAVGH